RRTPARPEVDPDALAAEGRQAHGLAIDVEQGERRAIRADERELRGLVAGAEALGRRRTDDERRGLGIPVAAAGRPERCRGGEEHENHGDDDDEADADLTGAERADEALALRPVDEGGSGIGHQIALLNVKYCGSRPSQPVTIATPMAITSRPPTIDTARPWRTSGRRRPGARS